MQERGKQLVTVSLWLGAASPFLYGAAQLLAASLYTGYDWQSQLASELGTEGRASSAIFIVFIVLTGLATMASAFGFKLGLEPIVRNKVFPWLIAASLVSSGAASVWAGAHPLPSPLHSPGYWGSGTVAFPLLMAAIVRARISWALRAYFLGTAGATVAFLLVSSGFLKIDLSASDGVLQRLGAFLVYFPVAVAAVAILRNRRSEDTALSEVRRR